MGVQVATTEELQALEVRVDSVEGANGVQPQIDALMEDVAALTMQMTAVRGALASMAEAFASLSTQINEHLADTVVSGGDANGVV